MKNSRHPLLYILSGGILQHALLLRHAKLILLIVLLLLTFIGNRYTCMHKLRDIDRLQQQLQDLRFEALSISSQLSSSSRQSHIEERIKDAALPLLPPSAPPYELQP
jgi:hypothetical protein